MLPCGKFCRAVLFWNLNFAGISLIVSIKMPLNNITYLGFRIEQCLVSFR